MRRVLVVEDHPDLRAAVSAALREAGFEVRDVGDGQSAVEVAETFRPELLCLDLVLPERSGYEVCEHLRADPRFAGLKVVVISGRAQAMNRAHAFEAGANAFLAKPFEMNALLAQVDALFDAPEDRPAIVAA